MAVPGVAIKTGKAVLTSKKGRKIIGIIIGIPIFLILLILSSPFAIFFALTTGDQVSIQTILSESQQAFYQRVEFELMDDDYDECVLEVIGSEDNSLIDNKTDVMCVFASKDYDKDEADQVLMLDKKKVKKLEKLYREMNQIGEEIIKEKRTRTVLNDEGEKVEEEYTYTIKVVIVDSKSAWEMADEYRYNKKQRDVLSELLLSSQILLLGDYMTNNPITQAEIDEIKNNLPANLSLERQKIVDTGLSLVGKVPYFWGGKSSAIGFDPKWNTSVKVTAPGSSTSGTYQPYGLDCSGFITWTFINVGLDASTIGSTIGHGTSNQFAKSVEISKANALPGDLVFIAVPNTIKVNHVGIVVGRNDDGEILVVHENGTYNNVTVNTAEEFKFIYFRRPVVLLDKEE